MLSFLSRKPRRPEDRRERAIRFVGEQDGPIERRLKTDLHEILGAQPDIRTAYLARVTYDDPKVREVVLALRSSSGEDLDLVRRVADCFARHFHREVHMDILFLSDVQEAEVLSVCPPFYRAV